jgi:hypothetical protein
MLVRLCVVGVAACKVFLSVGRLPSPVPGGMMPLFNGFSGTNASVRLPGGIHAGLAALRLLRPTRLTISGGYLWDLPVPVQRVSTHAQVVRLRETLT